MLAKQRHLYKELEQKLLRHSGVQISDEKRPVRFFLNAHRFKADSVSLRTARF